MEEWWNRTEMEEWWNRPFSHDPKSTNLHTKRLPGVCLSWWKSGTVFLSKMIAGASGPSCWVGHLCLYQSDFLQRPGWWISVCYPNYRSVVWLIMIVNSSRICWVVFPYPSCQWYSFHFLVRNGHWLSFTIHFQWGEWAGMHRKILHLKTNYLPSWELTCPFPRQFWRWVSFSQGEIC